VRRVSVIGSSGVGKTELARQLADRMGVEHIELDAIHHLADWQPIEPARFVEVVDQRTAGDGWVVDGNYRRVVIEGPVWRKADTVVWLDLPRRISMRRLVQRTLGRAVRREELWNGNHERLREALAWDPDKSVIRWAWTRHAEHRQRYEDATTDPRWAHLTFVRLRSRADVARFLASASPS
jgi:adenylate kinase family enzyme